MAEQDQVLTVDQLLSGDRPSLLVMGMVVARSIEKFGMAVIMPNALGKVVAMPLNAVTVLAKPLVKDEDLDQLSEEEAIALMAEEKRVDEDILAYLTKRSSRG
jgi:hypothetical protein